MDRPRHGDKMGGLKAAAIGRRSEVRGARFLAGLVDVEARLQRLVGPRLQRSNSMSGENEVSFKAEQR